MSDDEFTLEDLGLPVDKDLAGAVLSGYRLERELGRGAMGTVYLARRGAEVVVVKVLAAAVAAKPQLRSRFQREWAALARIDPPHANVVRVLAVDAQDPPHIVMEHIEGVPLLRLLQEHGRLDPEQATRIALDIARGLVVVHGLGLVHRDIKPANVIVTPSGCAKLVDFGVAKDVFMSSLTQAGQVLGTAWYMSPEQWGDAPVDARSDVFGLGATLYHLLVGDPPFQGVDVHETSDLARSGAYDAPRERFPEIPVELELTLTRMLIPSLRYRYGSMQDVVTDLERVLAGGTCNVPSLSSSSGARFPLLPARRYTLGSDPACGILLAHPSVSPRHAQIRREAEGFTVRDLKSAGGTYVTGERISTGRTLVDGERLRLGELELVFHDPSGKAPQGRAAPVMLDVRREELPDPVVRALWRLGDQSVVLDLLERLRADPVEERLRAEQLARLLGEPCAREVHGWCHSKGLRERAVLPRRLAALTGTQPADDPGRWLAWWFQVRAGSPPQVTSARPRRSLALRSRTGEQPLGEAGVTLIGRDPRCQVRIDDPSVGRLEATLLRLHRRLAVRSEAQGARLNGTPLQGAAFLDPGDTLEVGQVRLELVLLDVEEPRPRGELHLVDPDAFEALASRAHPAVAFALVQLLREARADWARTHADAAFPAEVERATRLVATIQTLYAERARLARQALPRILGQDAGADPSAWERPLTSVPLGPQVAPQGWLAATR